MHTLLSPFKRVGRGGSEKFCNLPGVVATHIMAKAGFEPKSAPLQSRWFFLLVFGGIKMNN